MLSRPLLRVGILLSASLISLLAQTPDTATLNGLVIDQTRSAIPDVQVTIVNHLTGSRIAATSDRSGRFSQAGLSIAGTYSLVASKQPFAPASLDGIGLSGGVTANVTVNLSLAGAQTKITVTGAEGEVRADSPQVGDRLDSKKILETPLLNRKITYLPLLNAANRPAINQGDVFMNQNLFTTNGSGRRQTSFEIDGSTGNDSWGRQTIFTNIPLAAVA